MDNHCRLTEKVWNYIKQHKMIENGDTVVVGVSGGADSVCLLFMLKEMQKNLSFSIQAVHIEHGIRGEDSRKDAEFVKSLCENLLIPFRIVETDVPAVARERKLSLEEAGRLVRYQAFEEEAKGFLAAKVAVAHHMNDQAETVLFHMIRGSKMKGLGGMLPVRGHIIRPLLCIKREEIEQYLSEKNINYCTDATNEELIYSRNVMRNRVIPVLEEIQGSAVEHIAQAAKELREAEDYLKHQAEKVSAEAVQKVTGGYTVRIDSLFKEEPIVRRYIIKALLHELFLEWKDITQIHIEEILALCEKSTGKEVYLPGQMMAVRLKESLFIGTYNKKQEEISEFLERPVNLEGRTELGNGNFLLCSVFKREKVEDIPQNAYTKWFDYDKIKNGLFVRTRRPQDYLCVNRELGRQKLKDYYINQKIPKEERGRLLLLAVEHQVVWVIGHRISEQFKITDETTRILKVQIIGGSYHERENQSFAE